MIVKLQDESKIEKGLFGWISKIKDRMYRTITPRGYHIGQAAKEFIKGDTRDMSKFTPLENEVWARYLGTKYEGPSNLEPAIYRPTKGEATYDDVVKLKDESLILSDNVLKLLLDNYKKTGKKSMLVEGNESGLGTYTISMGEDEKGKYISYYDDWDINPTKGISAKYNIPILNLIDNIVPGTHPFSVYGRRYYKNGGLIRRMKDASGGPIHYSRTITSDNLSKAANYVGEYILKGLGAFGKFLNAGFTSPTYGTTGQVSYARNAEDARRQRKLYESSELAVGKAMTWVSPLNYGAALATGNGLNARKGEEEVASWSPAWQAVGRLGELYVGPKAIKGVKATPRVVVNTAAKAGVKPAKAAVVAREINKGIKQNTNNGRIEITGNYFNSPDKWYRITETPEKYGIMELGKNVTTHDASQIYGTINGWRSSILKAPITKSSEGFIKRPPKIELGIRRKNGQAHGNTSQAAKGKLWGGTTSGSNLFPEGIIEGQAPSMINYGIDRTNFVMTPWELVPNGGRVGFHTGEMPMSNLGWFQKTNKGTYTYEPIIPEKRISYQPKLLLDSPTSLKFFERKPSKNNIVGTSLDYSVKDSKGIDFIKQFFALLKINGKEYTLEGLKDAANVQQGLPEYIQSYLNLNTVERAVRAMRKNGYSEREILQYVDKVNEEMNKVKVGMYSDLEYNAAGALDFGGFYNSDTNFISINKDALLINPAFTPNYIMKHEGRHLIDYNTSMTDDVINILEKAYDKDFLEIPKHEDAGNLKDYLHMDRERVTTNRDAREVLLSNLEKHPGEFLNLTKFAQTSSGKYKDMVDFLNELILYADPEDIINAVENSNGYGKRYINYLKKNNKLTSTKIEQLRLAMIHVPSYLLPVAGGYTLYNLFNQPLQQLQYLKQGGKMNAIEQFKQGHKIHIKKKNRGKFTAYCGGNVTSACIAKAKASGNPTLVKRATFAANARKWKHLKGGIIKAETGLSTSSFIDPMIINYIKAIENPNRVGWNGKIWKAPGLKGYDLNLRGYGIDINTNNAARKLTVGRQGQWLTDDEANTLMLDHIRYIMNAANKHIKGFGELPIGRKAALLGMLYRGDSVNKSNINITEPDDTKFFNSVHNYYISKGLKERANNSSKFFKSYGNSNTLNFNFNNYKDLNYPFKYIQ